MVGTVNTIAFLLIIYGAVLLAIKTVKKCSFSEARDVFASWFKDTNDYEISRDMNYKRDVNTACTT